MEYNIYLDDVRTPKSPIYHIDLLDIIFTNNLSDIWYFQKNILSLIKLKISIL